jgi:predicted DNA-binding protein (UPF0251 family)
LSRPRCCRRVEVEPPSTVFKPAGVPRRLIAEAVMTLDELESLRLADLEGLYHERAARRMAVSRSTFGRTLESARQKVAAMLVRGGALRIEGGPVHVTGGWSDGDGDEEERHVIPPGIEGDAVPRCPRCGWERHQIGERHAWHRGWGRARTRREHG